MPQLILSDAAEADLNIIAEYIADSSGDRAIAEAFVEKLYARFGRLAMLPGTLGTARPELRGDLRSVPESGYVIFFRYHDDALEIVNILHGSRDVVTYYDTGEN